MRSGEMVGIVKSSRSSTVGVALGPPPWQTPPMAALPAVGFHHCSRWGKYKDDPRTWQAHWWQRKGCALKAMSNLWCVNQSASILWRRCGSHLCLPICCEPWNGQRSQELSATHPPLCPTCTNPVTYYLFSDLISPFLCPWHQIQQLPARCSLRFGTCYESGMWGSSLMWKQWLDTLDKGEEVILGSGRQIPCNTWTD